MPPGIAKFAGLGALGAAAGLLLLPVLFALLTRPGQYAGMDAPNRALAWMAVAGVMVALALVHVVLGRQLLSLSRGDRNQEEAPGDELPGGRGEHVHIGAPALGQDVPEGRHHHGRHDVVQHLRHRPFGGDPADAFRVYLRDHNLPITAQELADEAERRFGPKLAWGAVASSKVPSHVAVHAYISASPSS